MAQQLSSGGAGGGAPPRIRAQVVVAGRHAFVSGLNEILLVAFAVAAAGAVLSFVLVRRRDFVQGAAHHVAEAAA